MNRAGLRDLAKQLYGGARALPDELEQSRFQTRMSLDPAAGELLLSPHFDDAVLDCWSLIASDRELSVVNLFGGVPGPRPLTPWDAVTGARDCGERVRERAAEDARALALAGRRPRNLSNLDAQYRSRLSRFRLAALDSQLLAAVQSTSRVYAPAAIGGHADHRLARTYARQLLAAGIPVTLYAELPYCIMHGWPHWVDDREPVANRDVDVYWRSFLDDVAELPPLREAEVVRLDDAQAAAKLEAMRCYASQMPCLDPGGQGLLERPETFRFEVRWELRRAPRESERG